MTLATPRDLFLHELSDLLSAENIFYGVLGELADLTENADARKVFSDHQKETQGHIDRLHKAFETMGEKPEKVTCLGAEGLRKEHDHLKEEKPTGLTKEIGLLIGADKSEHYEMCAYRNLMQVARSLGESDVADLLSETLAEEEEADKKVRSLVRDLASSVKAESAA